MIQWLIIDKRFRIVLALIKNIVDRLFYEVKANDLLVDIPVILGLSCIFSPVLMVT